MAGFYVALVLTFVAVAGVLGYALVRLVQPPPSRRRRDRHGWP